MRHIVSCVATILLCVLSVETCLAQVSPNDARRLGMEVAWNSQVQLPRVGRGIVSAQLWVNDADVRQYALVELPQRTIRVSADELNRDGEPMGLEEAKRRAQEEAARLLGTSEGFEVVEASVPEIKLVVVTADGLVQTLDAESGKLQWATTCGHSSAPAHPAALSPAGIVVIQGDKLYLLDWATGKQRMVRGLRNATSNAVAVSNDTAFVTDYTGGVESYGLQEAKRPWSYVMQGRAIGSPVSLKDQSFCAVASDRGFVYVFVGGNEPSAWIRYDTSSPINGSLAAGNGAFYAGTDAGLLTKIAVADRLGLIDWVYRTGQTISTPAFVVGGKAIVATESGDLFAIDDTSGSTSWIRAGLDLMHPVAQASGQIFVLSQAGEVYALDLESGDVTGRTMPASVHCPIVNTVNDRLYIVSDRGQLQCLRPAGALLPTLIEPQLSQPADEAASETQPTQPAADESANPFNFGGGAAAGNPFEAGGNPFGGATDSGDDAAGGMENPFGGGADPFGSGSGSDANPFGNPF